MSVILCAVAVQNGLVTRSSFEVLTRCREVAEQQGWTLTAAVLAPDARTHVAEVQRYGAARVYAVSHPLFRTHLNTPVVEALARVIAEAAPRVVAFPSSESAKDVLGALAVRAEAAVLPDVAQFEVADGAVEALRPVMAAKFLARTRTEAERVLVSVRAGSYEAAEAPAEAEVVEVSLDLDEASLRQTLRDVATAASGAVDLAEARVVVAAGRGVKDERGQQLVEELAEVTGAAIGATRAVVETGMYPATAQIGQTGKVVSPDLYFAVGLSGAVQHVAGMTSSRVIVAINRDPDAPIFKVATYGLVGDLYEILPPLIEQLKQASAT